MSTTKQWRMPKERLIRYTADLILPTGDDVDGPDVESGWYNPAWDRWSVSDDVDYALTEVYGDGNDPEDPARFIADRIARVVGICEPDTSVGVPTWYTSVDADSNYSTGVQAIVAGHPTGFTDDELLRAAFLMREQGTLISWAGPRG